MSKNFGQGDPIIAEYAEKIFKPEDQLLADVRKSAARAGLPDIHVGSMDGLHLEVLTRACGAKKAVEIGTLAGYSGINICRGLGPGGKLFTFEMSPKHAELAHENFSKAGFESVAEIITGPALEKLKIIESHGPFDLVFIDADKANYENYFQWAAGNLKVGGVILADNTFAWGMITQKEFGDAAEKKQVESLARFNTAVASHPNFRSTILPTGEGLTFGVKVK